MENSIVINKQNIAIKQYKGQRVVTFKDIDAVHGRPEATARRSFNANKKHFIEGTDYFKVCADEIRTHKIMEISPKVHSDITLLTESGYLMLAKSLTDKLAWRVQRDLVNNYFKVKEPDAQLSFDDITKEMQHEPFDYYNKMYNGSVVLTVRDIEYFTPISRYYIKSGLENGVEGVDYYHLKGSELESFKQGNRRFSKYASEALLITRNGFVKICNTCGVKPDTSLYDIEKIGSNVDWEKVNEYITTLRVLYKVREEYANFKFSDFAVRGLETSIHYVSSSLSSLTS